MANAKFDFHGLGLGELLQRYRLAVPPNQRSYAWEERQIVELFEDLKGAIDNNDEDYFLGTIVLIQNEDASGLLRVADGQQRLATITVLLARMRDHLLTIGRSARAGAIESEFLRRIDKKTENMVPRLTLNVEDNEFFLREILPSQNERSQPLSKIRLSNERLRTASEIATTFIEQAVLAGLRAELHADRLLAWVDFLEHKATVVAVFAPNDIGAFRMFETLNDRGLKASQADILKNYFFSRAGNRLAEAQAAWNSTSSSIEALNEDDDRLILYLRHFWITSHGPTRAGELAASMKGEINNETKTLQFVFDIRDAADDYLAVWIPGSQKWTSGGYKSSSRRSIETISQHLKVEQIRPLLFAVARKFDPKETDKALRLFVSWSVRFLVFGGRGGLLDRQYSLRAQEVGTGKITKARELREAMRDYVPTDAEFEDAFATARVSKPYLARYYLRALDRRLKADPEPEFVHNDDESAISLEHVMPLTPSTDWKVAEDVALTAQKLLGNMVLIPATKNMKMGNLTFAEKKKVYLQSSYSITNQVAQYDQWTIDQIRQRQREMAKLAVKTWPLTLAES